MPNSEAFVLTREEILGTANTFAWNGQLPKWTVIVEGRELPTRPLVLRAARVPPNHPINLHQAVAILAERGFDVCYCGKPVKSEERKMEEAALLDLIDDLRGSTKHGKSLLAAREREHRIEKDRWPR